MADRLAGGRLASVIAAFRAENVSWDDICRRLYADHGIEVSAETLRGWAAALANEESVA